MFTTKPKPEAIVIRTELTSDEVETYRRLAKKVGVQVTAPASTQLGELLQQEMIHVYDRAKVEKYMDSKVGRGKYGSWGWYPVTKQRMRWVGAIGRITPTDFPSSDGVRLGSVYPEPIPLTVLLTMEHILDKCPEVEFYVAAPSVDPDPFLAVAWEKEVYVIERWDEPGFRG